KTGTLDVKYISGVFAAIERLICEIEGPSALAQFEKQKHLARLRSALIIKRIHAARAQADGGILKLVANFGFAHTMRGGNIFDGSGVPGLRYLPWLVGRELIRHPEPYHFDGGYVPDDVKYLMHKAQKHYALGEFEESAACNTEIARINLAWGNEREAAKSLSLAAHDFSVVGKKDIAARYNEQAAGLFEQAGDLKSAETALFQAGNDYFEAKQYARSAGCNERCARVNAALGNTLQESKMYYFAARDWILAGDDLRAAFAYEKTAQADLRFDNMTFAARMLSRAASYYYRSGEYLKSAACSCQVAELNEKLHLTDKMLKALDMAANAYQHAGAYRDAASIYARLAQYARAHGHTNHYITYLELCARNYSRVKEYKLVLSCNEELERVFGELGDEKNAQLSRELAESARARLRGMKNGSRDGGRHGWSLRIPTRIPVDLHVSLLGFSLFILLPAAIVPFILLYAAATVHELTHAAFAHAYGMKVPAIKFNALSAFIDLDGIFTHPRQEFIVALVGPLINIILGLVSLVLCAMFAIPVQYPDIFALNIDILSFHPLALFAFLNLLIAATNLIIPVYPTDGARLSRSTFVSMFGVRMANNLQDYLNYAVGTMIGFAPVALFFLDMAVFKRGFIFGMGMLGLTGIYVSYLLLMEHDYRIKDTGDFKQYVSRLRVHDFNKPYVRLIFADYLQQLSRDPLASAIELRAEVDWITEAARMKTPAEINDRWLFLQPARRSGRTRGIDGQISDLEGFLKQKAGLADGGMDFFDMLEVLGERNRHQISAEWEHRPDISFVNLDASALKMLDETQEPLGDETIAVGYLSGQLARGPPHFMLTGMTDTGLVVMFSFDSFRMLQDEFSEEEFNIFLTILASRQGSRIFGQASPALVARVTGVFYKHYPAIEKKLNILAQQLLQDIAGRFRASLSSGDIDSAEFLMQDFRSIDPESLTRLLTHGIGQQRNHQGQDDISALEDRLKREPDDAAIHYQLGWAYVRAHKADRAFVDFLIFAVRDPVAFSCWDIPQDMRNRIEAFRASRAGKDGGYNSLWGVREFHLPAIAIQPLQQHQAVLLRFLVRYAIAEIGIDRIKTMSAAQFCRCLAGRYNMGFFDLSDARDWEQMQALFAAGARTLNACDRGCLERLCDTGAVVVYEFSRSDRGRAVGDDMSFTRELIRRSGLDG
ncbi:MAG TPA: hypothetical protein PK562_03765, partial [Candidatus Omnitrophota bacterium]|nr:hypothetical protein [Candidatus Omnitrophota bacterium]